MSDEIKRMRRAIRDLAADETIEQAVLLYTNDAGEDFIEIYADAKTACYLKFALGRAIDDHMTTSELVPLAVSVRKGEAN